MKNPTQNEYTLKPHVGFYRGENKVHMTKYNDPISLNFKLLIDYDKPYGLLADEKYTNSALAYLKRIGEDGRYYMLATWIQNLKTLVKNYEFLFVGIEGLDMIQNMKPGHMPTVDDKLVISIRETIDLRVQALITNYNQIWYDHTRGVEILPINLRRFDMSIVVFSGGVFNMKKYDKISYKTPGEAPIDAEILPTIRKLSDDFFNFEGIQEFNHVIYNLIDAQIMPYESGKTFAAEVSNEEHNVVKNMLTINYKFCNYSGTFNNVSGKMNYGYWLAAMSEINKLNPEEQPDPTFLQKVKQGLTDKFTEFTTLSNYKNIGQQILSDTTDTLRQKLSNTEAALFSNVGVVGDVLSKVSLEYGQQMVQNTIDLGINKLEEKLVDDPLARINNMLFNNFSNNLYDAFKTQPKPEGIALQELDPNTPKPKHQLFDEGYTELPTQDGIRYVDNQNIYGRKKL